MSPPGWRDSSTNEPKIMFASGSMAASMISLAAVISPRVMSGPPTMLKTAPVAATRSHSRSGDATARCAASRARSGPLPEPMPIRAVPALLMTDRTSEKSTLMRPGLTIMSEMPTTPWRRISSAQVRASLSGTASGRMSSSLSLAITISASTHGLSAAIDCMACLRRWPPSKVNGRVTTPTHSAPWRCAAAATTGAAPEPVPPPIPAVTKTISAPAIIFSISARLSSAACLPTSGMPPAPSPPVRSVPRVRASMPCGARTSAWVSVFITMNSTPPTP
mmetsp:Transcript_56119/g.154669  ORF Transcript_56119/g.154669 Transcript_56119/m.154669 type:complete len:277 (+) Transcript_56119:203-1033(+)